MTTLPSESRQFKQQFREWAAQPVATCPRTAARRITDRVRSRHRQLWHWAAATAAFAAIAVGSYLLHPRPEQQARHHTLPLSQPSDVVIDCIGSDAQVYFIITAPEAYGGSSG